jgi:Protein of unknown function (DUF3810)
LGRVLLALRLVIVLLAIGVALVPLPEPLVEQYYADWLYPALQARLTSWSNETSVSLFDVFAGVLGVLFVLGWLRALRGAVRRRSLWPVLGAFGQTVTLAAGLYLWFVLVWGFNYARQPLETVIGYDSSRVTPEALRALADRASDEVNRRYAEAHAAGFPTAGEMPPPLVTAMHEVEQRFGRPRKTTPSRPKRTLLGVFFRASGVDGMHAPFLLETLLNPDLTAPERPAVLAHEWAHLAGYAPEDDASFVGLLAALRADSASRYSAWLALFHDVVGQLPQSEQRRLIAKLDAGPRADREAIAARLESRVELVSRVSWQTYDQYLKSQGVREGIQSYSRVVQLILGSGAVDEIR